MSDDILDDPRDEYAVDAAPAGEHIDTVLADGFQSAVVNALSQTDSHDIGVLYDVHHMPTGEERRIEMTDELRAEIRRRE